MLFKIILLLELGCTAFFLCRYLYHLANKVKKGNSKILRTKPIPKQPRELSKEDINFLTYIENIDNYGTNKKQKDYE